ncbi:MAG: DMT family transporter [Pseudomonadota bacterium]
MPDRNRPLIGVLWMLATGLSFVAMTVFVKLVGTRLPAAEVGFLRYLLCLPLVVPALRGIDWGQISRQSWTFLSWRGAAHSLAVVLWFYAIARLPVAEVTALNYLAPVYVTIGAALFLGETLALRRIAAVVVAVCGALVILRPGFRTIDPAHLAILGGSVALGVSYLLAKRLTRDVSPEIVIVMLSVMVSLALFPVALWAGWVWPTWSEFWLLVLVAIFATAGHYFMTLAFREAPVSVTQPVTFLQLLWSALAGWIIFDEGLDIWVIAGGTVIVMAVSFIAWREHVLARQTTPPVEATKT